MTIKLPLALGVTLSILLPLPKLLHSQGMPAEARANIHTLFTAHASPARKIALTDSGYVALTESTHPEVVSALQAHVQQMSERLESGLRVRRWDAAFAEYVRHYRGLEHTFVAVEHGLRATPTPTGPHPSL